MVKEISQSHYEEHTMHCSQMVAGNESHVYNVPLSCTLHCPPFLLLPCSGDKVDTAGLTAGVVVVLVLLTLLGLTAGVSIGVVLVRRAQKKQISPLSSDNAGIDRAEAEEEGAEDHIYDVVGDISINGREVLYQGLVVGTQDYVSLYTQLRGGIYKELETWSREEEHHYQRTRPLPHYQRANRGRDGH